MTAFFGKLGQWATQYIIKLFVKFVADFIQAYLERRQATKEREEQERKDREENLPKYRETIKNGTEEDIDKATDSLLNS